MRIERDSRDGSTVVRLIGHFQSEHIEELQNQILEGGLQFSLDLAEITLVDLDVVRFLGVCEASGVKLLNCSQYIREWIRREKHGGDQSEG